MSNSSICDSVPRSRMDLETLSAPWRFLSKIEILTPSSARRLQIASPMPLPPPVTIATLPLRPRIKFPFSSQLRQATQRLSVVQRRLKILPRTFFFFVTKVTWKHLIYRLIIFQNLPSDGNLMYFGRPVGETNVI